jgi:protein-disulfide isomerase
VAPCVQHAAEAAESAAAQNKFWEMHGYLYVHQQALNDNHLEKSEQSRTGWNFYEQCATATSASQSSC